MALRGWRLFGVAGTIVAYVVGILLLSLVSLNNSPNQKRPRTGRFGEFDAFRRNEVSMVSKRQPLQWCQPLRFNGQDAQTPTKVTTAKPRIRFHALSADYARAPPNEPFQEMFPARLPDKPQPPKPKPKDGRVHTKTHPLYTANIRQNQKSTTFDSSYVDRYNDISKSKTFNSNQRNINSVHKLLNDGSGWFKKEKINQKDDPNTGAGVDAPSSDLIALASFPGSGNTWLRYLLQQATGIYTGSVYKDFGLLKSGFPGENVFNSSVLVVKTHEWGPKDYALFARAILLVRDPDKAILAEFNRQSGGHVGFASPDRYRRTKGRYWQQFVTNKLWAWEQMNTQWAHNFTGAIQIIYYDDLVADVEGTLRTILNFIRFPINEDLLQCAITRKEGIYRRKKRILTFDPYTPEMHVMLETKKRQVYADLGRTKF